MFCPKCGTTLPDSAEFCGSCGAKLEKLAAEAAVQGPIVPGGAPAAASIPAGYAAHKAPKKPLVIGIAAVALVAAVGIGAYFAFFAPYNIDDKTFPDEDLRSLVAKQIDKDRDGKITRDEARAVFKLDLSGTDVESLEGIQLFENMTELDISSCASLDEADFSKLAKLESLNARGSGLKEIDVSKLAALESLDVSGTGIEEIDVAGNAKLESFKVDDAVDVTGVSATKVRERWFVAEVYDQGYTGTYDADAGGNPAESTRTTYTYNDDNQITKYQVVTRYPAQMKTDDYTYTQEYTYEDGKLTSAESSNSASGPIQKSEITYDDEGNVTQVVSSGYGSSGSTVTKFEYEDGKATQQAIKYGSGTYNTTNYEYDDNGRFTGARAKYANVKVAYNDQGLVESVASDWQVFEFDYNDKGQCVEKRVYWMSNGKKSDSYTKIRFEYDDEGRISSAVRTGEGATDYTYKSEASVEYDKHGNVIRRDVSYSSTSGGKTYSNDGSTQIEYKRVFVAKGEDVASPISIGDPTNVVVLGRPIWGSFLDETQPEMVAYALEMVGCSARVYL